MTLFEIEIEKKKKQFENLVMKIFKKQIMQVFFYI